MWDFHRGRAGVEIVERDDGYITPSGGPDVYFTEHRHWPRQEKRAVRLARGRVLDVGCGAGRHALYLQQKGLDVTGIDESPLAIRTCRDRGLRKARVMGLTAVSARLGAFDTVLMFGNNFGLFGNSRRARWLLRRLRRMASDRARIIATSCDPYRTEESDHLRYHRRNRRSGRMAGQVRIRVRYKDSATPWFDLLLVSQDEMRDLVRGTGWRVARTFDSGGPGYAAVIEKGEER
jgi:SAM-dependent methyltransferase